MNQIWPYDWLSKQAYWAKRDYQLCMFRKKRMFDARWLDGNLVGFWRVCGPRSQRYYRNYILTCSTGTPVCGLTVPAAQFFCFVGYCHIKEKDAFI